MAAAEALRLPAPVQPSERLNDEQVKEFQRYLIYNHAAGIGEPAPIEYVRAALTGR